ncbi:MULTISPECIES: CapA family protein [Bacillaceae]|uniref:CapA family protein n=1 Tax=Bacillaceae TaxID=186817 RepID=UPI001F3B25C0|nr:MULTISPECIES: CapA family protein [Bacillaceae]
MVDKQEMLGVGDIALGPDPDDYFQHVLPLLHSADVRVGQLEVPYTLRHPQAANLGRDPNILQTLVKCDFDVLTLAGNHIVDAGVEGIEDTMSWLKDKGINTVGAGMNIQEARRSVVIERNGLKYGFLDYNCVGPMETWATMEKPGCAYVGIQEHYEPLFASPGSSPVVKTWADHHTLKGMLQDIQLLRPQCDVLVVNLHKGVGHTRAKIADYEFEITHAAIDAGADTIFSHHAHILKGIEVYKGKTIYHGLCNFATYIPPNAFDSGHLPKGWAEKRKKLFGFEPDPEYPTYPFHPEARYTIIASCQIESGTIVNTGFYPCIINKKGHPVVVSRHDGGQEVLDYMSEITREAELKTTFYWESDTFIGITEGE